MEKKIGDNNNISDYVDGLYVKNGRLINGRPDSITGIQQAANIKRMIDRQKQSDMIADGIEKSEMRKNLFG